MARLIAAIIFALSSFGAVNGAYACSRVDQPTDEDLFKTAHEVFHALVVRTALSDDHRGGPDGVRYVVQGWYEIKEILKGDPAPNEPIVTTNLVMGGCGLHLLVGQEYVFYPRLVHINKNETLRYVDILDGTRWLPLEPGIAEQRVEQIRKIKRRVEDSERLGGTPSPTPP